MAKKRPSSLEMLAQVMAQMAVQEAGKPKPGPAPLQVQTIYQAPTGGK